MEQFGTGGTKLEPKYKLLFLRHCWTNSAYFFVLRFICYCFCSFCCCVVLKCRWFPIHCPYWFDSHLIVCCVFQGVCFASFSCLDAKCSFGFCHFFVLFCHWSLCCFQFGFHLFLTTLSWMVVYGEFRHTSTWFVVCCEQKTGHCHC